MIALLKATFGKQVSAVVSIGQLPHLGSGKNLRRSLT